MAALSKRDIEMIFRAETDGATRDIRSLKGSVTDLRKALSDQIAAAEKGQGSLDDIAKTARDLKKAQDELGTARGFLTNLNAQERSAANAAARVEKLTDEVADLQRAFDGAEKPTKRLTNSLEAKSRALEAAKEKAHQEAAAVADVRKQIEGIIGPVHNFEESFKDIAVTGKEIARGLAIAGDAADEFKTKMAQAASSGKNADQFSAMVPAIQSPEVAGKIAAISQYEDRVERLKGLIGQLKSEERAEAAAVTLAAVQRNAAVDEALNGNRALEAEIAKVAAEAERLDQLHAFQQIASQARAATADVGRFTSSFDPATIVRFGEAIENIQNPTKAALGALDGIEAEVVRANNLFDASVTKYKPTVAQAATAANELAAAQASLNRAAGQIDGLRQQQAAVDKARASFEAAKADVGRLATEIERADAPSDELAAAMKRAQGAVEQTGNALAKELTSLDRLSTVARKAGIDVGNLATSEQRITKAATEAAAAQKRLGDVTGASGKKGFLGLNPNELQNLTYQVNDVFTSLSSGISLQQTVAQQGGQIFQIFQGRIASIIPVVVRLLPILAGLAFAFAALAKAANEASRLRAFQATVDDLGNNAGNSAAGMLQAARAAEMLGAKAEDADKAVTAFVRGGLDATALKDFTVAAQNLASVTGESVPDAAQKLVSAFSGSAQSLVANKDIMSALTDEEQAHAIALANDAKEQEAREYVFDRFYDKQADAAQKMGGPWAEATRALSGAFRDLFADIASGASQAYTALATFFANAVKGFAVVINVLGEFNKKLNANRPQSFKEFVFGIDPKRQDSRGIGDLVKDAMADTERQMAPPKRSDAKSGGKFGGPAVTAGGQEALTRAKLQGQITKANVDLSKKQNRLLAEQATRQLAVLDAQKSGFSVNEQQAMASLAVDRLRDGYAKKDKARDDAAAKRRTAQAAALAREYASQQNTLDNALGRMTASSLKAQGGSIEDEVKAVRAAVTEQYTSMYNQLDAFRAKFGAAAKIHGMSQDAYKGQIDANVKILQDQAEMQTREKAINDLLAQRSAKVSEIQNQIDSGALDPSEGFMQIVEVTSKIDADLAAAIDKARTFIATLTPSPETVKMLAALDKVASAAAPGAQNKVQREAGDNIYSKQDSELNKIISERNNLIAANNELVKLGALSYNDAQAAAKEAFATTGVLIQDQIDKQHALNAVQLAAGSIDQVTYDAREAHLRLIGQQAEYTDARLVQLHEGMNNIVSQNFTTFVNQAAQALAGMADGATSVGRGLLDIGRAFVSFVAQTLIAVGQLIVQALILSAIDKATGGILSGLLRVTGGLGGMGGGGTGMNHAGGTIGSYGGGRQNTTRSPTLAQLSAGVPRYHSGTPGVGLRSNEQMAVLEKGEKVVTEEQQRQEAAANARQGSGGTPLRQVLAFGDDQVAAAMQGRAGESTTLTHIRRNAPMIKQMLGGN